MCTYVLHHSISQISRLTDTRQPCPEVPQTQRTLVFSLPSCAHGLWGQRRLSVSSVKARGGVYEVLKFAEGVAVKAGLLGPGDCRSKLVTNEAVRKVLGEHRLVVRRLVCVHDSVVSLVHPGAETRTQPGRPHTAYKIGGALSTRASQRRHRMPSGIRHAAPYENAFARVCKTESQRRRPLCLQVGSTGNLGLSIGITGAAMGLQTEVHMSCDAKQWKKDLLRSRGVKVVEHTGNYSVAVTAGRESAVADPRAHFVDDERSMDLLLGYSTAAFEVMEQLDALSVEVRPSL